MTGRPKLDALVAGDLFFDLTLSGFKSWPRPGEEYFVKEFHKEIGGGATITACGLAKLGIRTGLLGYVGKEDGQWFLDQLRERNVETSAVLMTSAAPTAFSVGISTAQDRTFLTYTGANRELPSMMRELASSAAPYAPRHIHLAHALDLDALQSTFKSIKDRGWTLSVDVGWHPDWLTDPRATRALKLVDIFFPNEREAAVMTRENEPERMFNAFREMEMARVALKLGQDGAALLWDGQTCFQKPGFLGPNTTPCVDTTGAGDCFDAGFLYAWLNNMEPAMCLKIGAACGELSTRALGGIAGFPSKEELEAILCTAK